MYIYALIEKRMASVIGNRAEAEDEKAISAKGSRFPGVLVFFSDGTSSVVRAQPMPFSS